MSQSRWKEIVERLRLDVEGGRWHPGDRLPSESELAQQWGVSRMTAHRALNELQRMGLVVRRRRVGTVVASNRQTGCIALLLHNSHDRLEMEYMRGIHAGIGDERRVVVCDTNGTGEKEAYYLRRMATESEGIILFPTCLPQNTPLITHLLERGTHIICIDRSPEGVSVDAFVTDNYGCTLESLRYLIGQGIYPIAHLTQVDLWTSSVKERYSAYIEAMRERGYPSPERLCRHFPVMQTRYRFSLTQLATDALIALKYHEPALRAVFCLNDYHLVAVLEACEQLGWRVPEDLHILSFQDCVSLLPQMSRRIHRLVQQPFELGRRAAERLMQRLSGHALPFSIVRLPASFYPVQHHITTLEEVSNNETFKRFYPD